METRIGVLMRFEPVDAHGERGSSTLSVSATGLITKFPDAVLQGCVNTVESC